MLERERVTDEGRGGRSVNEGVPGGVSVGWKDPPENNNDDIMTKRETDKTLGWTFRASYIPTSISVPRSVVMVYDGADF